MEQQYFIAGTHCHACQLLLEQRLKQLPGVTRVRVNYRTGNTAITYRHDAAVDRAAVARVVADAGYRLASAPIQRTYINHSIADWFEVFFGVMVLFLLYGAYRFFGFDQLSGAFSTASSAGSSLVVGLIAGISTCMALIGSFVLAFSAQYARQHPTASAWQRMRPNVSFNVGRIVGFALLGGIAGLIGSAFGLDGRLLGLLIMMASVAMIVLGAKLTGLFPRLEQVTLPARLAGFVGMNGPSGQYSHTRAGIAGMLTFFLPCAFTQTIQILAVSTGNFVQGALVMSAFALGTAPGLLGISSIAGFLKGETGRIFIKVAGTAVLILGLWNLQNGWNLTGITLASQPATIQAQNVGSVRTAQLRGDAQYIETTQDARGYSPKRFRVKAGIPLVWTVNSTNSFTCAASIYIPSLGIAQNLEAGPNTIRFTPPTPGIIKYSCSMGMYTGIIEVVE